jgi:hypothetical protein
MDKVFTTAVLKASAALPSTKAQRNLPFLAHEVHRPLALPSFLSQRALPQEALLPPPKQALLSLLQNPLKTEERADPSQASADAAHQEAEYALHEKRAHAANF